MNEKVAALGGLVVVLFYMLVCVGYFLPQGTLLLGLSTASGQPTKKKTGRETMRKGASLVPVSLNAKIEGNTLILGGTVPDNGAKSAILQNASKSFVGKNIVDKISVNKDLALTDWFDQVLTWFPPPLPGLNSGTVSVSGTNVSVAGRMSNALLRDDLPRALQKSAGVDAKIQSHLEIDSQSAVPTAAAPVPAGESNIVSGGPRESFTKTLRGRVVKFDDKSAALGEDGKTLLNDLVPFLQQFPDAAVQISGLANDVQSSARFSLSDARAKSIKEYLVHKGIEAKRLITRGCSQYIGLAGRSSEAEECVELQLVGE